MSVQLAGKDYWAHYNAKKAAERAAAAASEAGPKQDPIRVLEPMRELLDAERSALKGTIGALQKRLGDQGWTVRVFRSLVRMPAVLFQSDSDEGAENPHRQGDVRYAAHDLESWVLFARFAATACRGSWERKDGGTFKFAGAETFDPVFGREWRPKASSSRPQNSIEAEEGIEPPLGFNPWLDLMAPKSLKKKKETV